MSKQKPVQCPHCDHIGEVVWVGFASDWVICRDCQRKVHWHDVRRDLLVTDDDGWVDDLTTPSHN